MERWIGGLACLWLMASVAEAGQVSIGFEGSGEGPAPIEMPEDGYRIVTRDMMISSPIKSGNGSDGPNEIESAMNTRGAVAILRDAPFTFVSLDWQTETGAPQVVVEGYLGSALVARDRFVARGTYDTFTTHPAEPHQFAQVGQPLLPFQLPGDRYAEKNRYFIHHDHRSGANHHRTGLRI